MIPYTLLEFNEVNSTSDFLKENHTSFSHMTFVRADYQTNGRGQYTNHWESKPYENILFSLLLKNVEFHQIMQLKTWMITTLKSFLQEKGIDAKFKEPNDLYVENRKIAGILFEALSDANHFIYVVIGVGININQRLFNTPDCTSLNNELGHLLDLKALFNELLEQLLNSYKNMFY
ncbi:MAG: biotin--[acetyl-CoA-carboxylase] ligase [Acholeplasmataceae bacterium]|nr:biotin--[acetyl-CoA-carboxylase] ligase [Acholeplasmataceae bacterium]